MNYSQIRSFALATPRIGYLNQVIGALHSLADLFGYEYDDLNSFLLPEGGGSVYDVKDPIVFSDFENYDTFKTYIWKMLDTYIKKVIFPPRVFVTPYDMTENSSATVNADMLCRAIKEYYKHNNLGFVLTALVNGRLYDYKYVDLVNVPKHLLTLRSRMKLLQNKALRKKVLFTLGTINNFSRNNVSMKYNELLKKITENKNDISLNAFMEKFSVFSNAAKKVVFCLGGRVEGTEILFDITYAQHLYVQAEKLAKNGYGVIFVNGPRTPNDVTDFLYSKSMSSKSILFQNCKPIATSDEERMPQKWRIYSGKYEDDFKILQKIGNIYPAVLGFDNTLVVHTMDSYSGCETSGAAIPTAISAKGIYVDPNIRYDCHNLVKILCPKYAVDFDEFVDLACNLKLEPNDLKLSILPNSQRVFAETAVNRLYQETKR